MGFACSGMTVRCGGCVGPPPKFSPLVTFLTFGPHSWLRRFIVLEAIGEADVEQAVGAQLGAGGRSAACVFGSRVISASEPLKRRQPATIESSKSFSSVIE